MQSRLFTLSLIFLLLGSTGTLLAQTPIENQIPIWPGTAPGSEQVTITEEINDRDPDGGRCYLNRSVRKVIGPSIKYFAPANPNGSAVLICPGGGYALLAYDKEGYDIARWYAERDITAFVLKYRLPIDGHENRAVVPLQDAQRAMRYLKANASTYGIDPDRIGVMGGSAGGHLAASLSVFYNWETYAPFDDLDTLSAIPAFSVLMYPVISFQDSLTHGGSRTNLLGSEIDQLLKDSFSTNQHVDADTPPAFLFHNRYDGSVNYRNSLAYAAALEAVGGSAKVHIYESSGHGSGKCEAGQSAFSYWPVDLEDWLVSQGWTTPCLGNTPTVSLVPTGDTLRLATEAAAAYQWYRNNILIPEATDRIFTPALPGDYKVAVQGQRADSGSDCFVFSDPLSLETLTHLADIDTSTLRIYPNPASSHLYLAQLPGADGATSIQFYNQVGARVRQDTFSSGDRPLRLDLQSLDQGVYYLKIKHGEQLYLARFIKQ